MPARLPTALKDSHACAGQESSSLLTPSCPDQFLISSRSLSEMLAGPGWPRKSAGSPQNAKRKVRMKMPTRKPNRLLVIMPPSPSGAALHGIEDKFSGVGEKALQSGSPSTIKNLRGL